MYRFELTRFAPLNTILKSRLFQPAVMLVMLFFFVVAILAGFFGTPAGSRNFGIIFVWIVWWALLIIVLVPFLGRAWCTICPIPGPGEWLQRRGLIRRLPGKLRSLGWKWPRQLRNIWLQNLGFLAMALFSTVILTRPGISAWVLLAMILLAVALSIFYENRVFCRYVCPVGGFIGLYSLTSTLELRVKDAQVCQDHGSKECITGNAHGFGCPWMVYPGNLTRSAACGLCTECLKTCSQNNIAINIRPFGTDLLVEKGRRLDEAYKALIMLACALLYSGVLLGPWGTLKNWANMESLPGWGAYAAGFLAINLLALPGLFWLATFAAGKLARLAVSPGQWFINYAYSLVPMGLIGWIAFSVSFVFVNGSYAVSVLSDPFGWGWDLFGTRAFPWTPFLSNLVPHLQTGLLLGGLVFSVHIAHRISRQQTPTESQALRGTLPVAGFLLAITFAFLRLYL